MNYKDIRLFLTSSMLFVVGNVCPQEWISLGNNLEKIPITTEVLEDNENSYKVHIILNGLYDKELINEYGKYHFLSLGGDSYLMNEGNPELPLITYSIAIPPETTPSISIDEKEWNGLSIGKIFPVQKLSCEEVDDSNFYIIEDAYKDSFLPQLFTSSKEMVWRGIKNFAIHVCPFKYYPQYDSLSILSDFVLDVRFLKQNKKKGGEMILHKESSSIGLFDNTAFSSERANNPTNDSYDYLIMLGNDLLNGQWLDEFRRWKAYKGLKTKVVSLDTIGNSNTSVKNYITNERNNKGIKYVLLVGNHSMIPSKDYNYNDNKGHLRTCESDYWFGCIDGDDDVEQDVAIGRFPISSSNPNTTLRNMVIKTINYESWKNLEYEALLVSHYGVNFISCCNTISDSVYSEFLPFIKYYGNNDTINNQIVNTSINHGSHIINYRGHASDSYWGNSNWNYSGESYHISEINNYLPNTNAVFFSIACNTGDIFNDTCMLNTFMRSPKGATSFLGSSMPSDDFENTRYNIALYKKLLNSMNYCYGDLIMKTSLYNIQNSPTQNLAIDNVFSYICGGDPALELWTGTPLSFGDVTLTEGGSNITITTQYCGSYKVCLARENGDLIGVYSVSSGNTCTFPRPSGNFYIGITKHNFVPKVIKYDVTTDAVQDEEITMDSYYHYTPIAFGDGVSLDISDGPVIVKNGTKLVIKNGTGGVRFVQGFECEKGAILEVK